MWPILCAVVFSCGLCREKVADPFLESTPARAGKGVPIRVAYLPQPGDIVLLHEQVKIWDLMFRLVGSGPPDHSGLMVRLPDGRMAMLEAGPENGKGGYIMRVCLLEVESRLRAYPGRIWIRRLRSPLTPEQSAKLTDFALAQEGKPYSVGRLLLQLTPIRARGERRRQLLGKTDLNRRGWICSELVVAACTVVGLMDPANFPANAIYPLDLLQDTEYDLRATWHPAEVWSTSAVTGAEYGALSIEY